ncbi:MAG TPA: hypothetical protein VL133_08130 [Devosia sp.]|nr:hypothetical protein [Devosia sp.]
MKLSATELPSLAASANLAPSVHNTQPTRWRLADDGALWLTVDPTRQLSIGDATGRDLRVSLGAALEGTALALAERGLGIGRIDYPEALPSARIELNDRAVDDPLVLQMPHRLTWRKGFATAAADHTQALAAWAVRSRDIIAVAGSTEIAFISGLNERTSLAFYRNAAYRHELVSWMRLSRANPRFGIDGLSAPAMGLSGLEAFGAGIILRDPTFGLLDSIGLIGNLISEHRRTASAAAILLFHRPVEEHPIETGRALYRRLLELSALGFQTWPMAVLADGPEATAELKARYGIAEDRRLITAWRTGMLPAGAMVRRERLPAAALIGQ